MKHTIALVALGLLLTTQPLWATGKKYNVRSGKKKAVPAALNADTKQLLGDDVIEFLDDSNKVIADIWFRKTIPAKASKKAPTYRDVAQTTVIGAIQFHQQWHDYRKQKVKPGVYTLRIAHQPQDGDHMGTAPHPDFCILISAKLDPHAKSMNPKEMVERSAAAMNTTHPGVLLLFPNKSMGKTATLGQNKAGDHTYLLLRRPIANATAQLGFALTLVGHANE